ncbi:hypothetical protein BC940DRAFT_290471 [Gongronella butleri]|nr:hypothetical protein BC940DRAFT_290471 [Gongronella butleri]
MSSKANNNESNDAKAGAIRVYGILTKAQAISGSMFACFAVLHGVEIASGALGGATANMVLKELRPIYQNAFFENVFIGGALTVHLIAGLGKTIVRSVYKLDGGHALGKLHYYAGGLLVPLIGFHFALVRNTPRDWGVDVDFSIIGWGFQNRAVITGLIHGPLLLAGAYHMLLGAPLAINRLLPKSVREKGTRVPSPSARTLLATTIGLFVGTFVISRMDISKAVTDYGAIYAKVFPF